MTDVAVSTLNMLSVCTGGGGLDLGIRLAIPAARVVCYVEREVTAAALLVAHMQAGDLDDAPLWTDLRTFDGRPWRGLVDAVIGGIPCQPFSSAGKRRGESDDRNLWPDALCIVDEVQPEWCFFENVPGMANRSVDWYYYRTVEPRLHEMGFRVATGLFSAAEIGASHKRERLFILANRDDERRIVREGDEGTRWQAERSGVESRELVNPNQRLQGRNESEQERGYELPAWPPGPKEHNRWASILAARPELAPALSRLDSLNNWRRSRDLPFLERESLQPGTGRRRRKIVLPSGSESHLRQLAHELASGLARRDRLSILGNGVVPAQAVLAFSTLMARRETPNG